MIVVNEMQKLREWLDVNDIKWVDKSLEIDGLYICRAHFWYKDYFVSVINGHGTYGGYNTRTSANQGLLEMMTDAVNGGAPVGWLTADEVIKRLEEVKE